MASPNTRKISGSSKASTRAVDFSGGWACKSDATGVIDHHTIAIVSVCGIGLDVLGGLYLAYDLLGGQYGPLRLLTRMVTYSVVLGIGYGVGLGLVFGIACGIA